MDKRQTTSVRSHRSQIKSKERVAKHGEVFTAEREVKAMLDLVKDETNKIESTFLEPACGDGNFLAEIIRRKLAFIRNSKKPKYKNDQPEYEKAMLVAVGSIYGIDIMHDNVKECVARLYKIVCDEYYSEDVEHCIRYILSRNIVCGDARIMKDYEGKPIVFSEWKNPSNGWIKRKTYKFEDLFDKLQDASPDSETLVSYSKSIKTSDTGASCYLPREIKDYGNIDYREVFRYEEQE